eukprot:CAMPEP_0114546930 /NCGR_PEP_ID=MMETSP0114-20121206/4194_1 /TAXON_ID=31324 /ORGANISM="Goniomonas sp, Strain m" /LENGTH=504 /DNA_ID=CAMNT_0001731453 /DNA_START=49 /DNA_END=1561 /DNA_ORIENTATION=-
MASPAPPRAPKRADTRLPSNLIDTLVPVEAPTTPAPPTPIAAIPATTPDGRPQSRNGIIRYQPNIKRITPAKTWEKKLEEEQQKEKEEAFIDELVAKPRPKTAQFQSVENVVLDPVRASAWFQILLYDCGFLGLIGAVLLSYGVWMYYELGEGAFAIWFVQVSGLTLGLLSWAGGIGTFKKKLIRVMMFMFFMAFMAIAELGFVVYVNVSLTFQARTTHLLYNTACVNIGNGTLPDLCACDLDKVVTRAEELGCVQEWLDGRLTLLAAFFSLAMIAQFVSVICSLIVREKILVQLRSTNPKAQGGILIGLLHTSSILLICGGLFSVGLSATFPRTVGVIVGAAVTSFITIGLAFLSLYSVSRYNLFLIRVYIIGMGLTAFLHLVFVAVAASDGGFQRDTANELDDRHCDPATWQTPTADQAVYCMCELFDRNAAQSSQRQCAEEWVLDRMASFSAVGYVTVVLQIASIWAMVLFRRTLLRIQAERELEEEEGDDFDEVDDIDKY